jgi:peroxiredoxin
MYLFVPLLSFIQENDLKFFIFLYAEPEFRRQTVEMVEEGVIVRFVFVVDDQNVVNISQITLNFKIR